jgi:hypothetical protein
MTTWTVESIESRRATGDALGSVGDWCCSYVTDADGTRLSLYRSERYQVVERDPRDGEIFASSDDAACYALNAGRLQWFLDFKAMRG